MRSAASVPRRGVGAPMLTAVGVAGCLAGLGLGLTLVRLASADDPIRSLAPEWGVPAVRVVFDAAGVVTVGLTLLPLLLRDARAVPARPVLALTHRAGVVTGTLWAAAAGQLLWLQVAAATGTSPLTLPARRVGDYLAVAAAGRALVVAGLCGLAVAVVAAIAARRRTSVPPGLAPVPAVLGVLALPVTGHAADAPLHELAVLAVAVHVGAAAAWVGGLVALAWLAAPRRELLAVALPRYSRLATACLVAVAATGLLGAVLRLPSAAALLGSGYGWILLGKGVGLTTLGVLGGYARARLLPAIPARRPVKLAGWFILELAVMGAVIGLASVLAGAASPSASPG